MQLLEGPVSATMIVGAVLIVAVIVGGYTWWSKKTRGGRQAPK